MKQIKCISYLLVAIVVAISSSCSSNLERSKVEYIPFQETKDGQWGMVSMDGKVLFNEEFKNEPTMVRDGRFFVKNSKGLWEMYEASEKPKKIGEDYVYTSGFSHGRALVAERNKPVTLIDTEGNVVKELDRIANKKVVEISSFTEGRAIFMTSDSLCGAIDEDGDCVVQPEYVFLHYGMGMYLAVHSKYKKFRNNKDANEKIKLSILDDDGTVTKEFQASKCGDFGAGDSKFATSVKKGDEDRWTIYSLKGEILYQCTSKVKSITQIKGETFIYNNGEGWGLMNFKGETLIRAKYESLVFDGDRLIAGVKKGDDTEYKFINNKDQSIGSETYEFIWGTSNFDGEHAVVKVNDKEYSLIDEKGAIVKNLPDMVDVSIKDGDDIIKSDYVDMDNFLTQLGFKASGIDGFTFNSTPQTIVQRLAALGYLTGNSEHQATDPYWYDYKDKLEYTKEAEGVYANITISFYDRLSQENFHKKRVIDYNDGDYTYYHDEQKSTGYTWKATRPKYFLLIITNDGKMHGKLRMLFNKIASRLEKEGTLAKGNNGAKVFKLKNGLGAFLTLEKDWITVIWWGDIAQVSKFDIEEYKDNTEDLTNEDLETKESSSTETTTTFPKKTQSVQ